MCGLVGMVSINTKNELDTFRKLFVLNAFRGMHGSGVILTYDEKKDAYYNHDKSTKPSNVWALTKEFNDFIDRPGLKSILGHSRHATVGDITIKNNHPFKTKDLLGMHNGTIRGKFEGSDKFETDSEALYNLIQTHGAKKALEMVYDKANSVAYALQWYDRRDDCIRLIRNHDRPLYIASHKNFFKVFWSSTRESLVYAIDSQKDLAMYDIEQVPAHTLITINPNEKTDKGFIVKEEKYFVPPVKTYNTTYYSGAQSEFWDNYHKTRRRVPANSHNGNSQQNKKEKKFFSIGKRLVESSVLEDELLKGCCMCSSPSWDYKEVKYLTSGSRDFLCETCLEGIGEDVLRKDWQVDPDKFLSVEEVEQD